MLKHCHFPTNQWCFLCWLPESLKDKWKIQWEDTVKDTVKQNITYDWRFFMLLAPVIRILGHFELGTFYDNIILHLENQYLPARFDESSYHCFAVIFDFPRNSFFFNLQHSKSQLRIVLVVNYFHKSFILDVKQGSEYASVSSKHPNSAPLKHNQSTNQSKQPKHSPAPFS